MIAIKLLTGFVILIAIAGVHFPPIETQTVCVHRLVAPISRAHASMIAEAANSPTSTG